jgi:hypothetical protein
MRSVVASELVLRLEKMGISEFAEKDKTENIVILY